MSWPLGPTCSLSSLSASTREEEEKEEEEGEEEEEEDDEPTCTLRSLPASTRGCSLSLATDTLPRYMNSSKAWTLH